MIIMSIKSGGYAGTIVNYFSEQLLERDFTTKRIPFETYAEYISENDIDIVFIDNMIYESDHSWFEKEIKLLLYHLEKTSIKIVVIKNTREQIKQLFKGLFIWEIGDYEKISYSYNQLKTPVLLNEYLYNPINNKKTIDILLVKFDKSLSLNNDFNINRAVSNEILINQVTRERLQELLFKIRKSKIIVLDYNEDIDRNFILYLEAIVILTNSIFILEEQYQTLTEYNNRDNKSYMKALLNSDVFMHKNCIGQNRQKMLENTLINKRTLKSILNGEVHNDNINISIITPSIRKSRLPYYIEQLNRQKLVNIEAILLTHNYTLTSKEKERIRNIAKFKIIIIEGDKSQSLGVCLNKCLDFASKEFVTKMDDDDYYYANYLIDQWIAKKYSQADVTGKGAHFVYLENNEMLMLRSATKQYKFVKQVIGGSIFCETEFLKTFQFNDLSSGEDSDFFKRITSVNKLIYANHPYEMCLFRSKNKDNHTWKIEEIKLIGSSQIVSYGSPDKYLEVI